MNIFLIINNTATPEYNHQPVDVFLQLIYIKKRAKFFLENYTMSFKRSILKLFRNANKPNWRNHKCKTKQTSMG